MIAKLVNYIVEFRYGIFNPILLLMVLLVLGSIAKGRRFPFISFILTILSIGGFLVRVFIWYDKTFFGYDFLFILGIFIIFSCVFDLLAYLFKSIRYIHILKIITSMPSNIESNIYIYLDQKSKYLLCTDQFYRAFPNIKPKMIFKKISHFILDEKELSLKEFFANLKSYEEKNFKLTIVLKNNQELNFEILKRKVISKGKLLGYVLINQKTMVSEIYKENINREFKQKIFNYFSLLEEPVCYFDQIKKKYMLSNDIAKILGINEYEIEEDDFLKYVYDDDRKMLYNRKIQADSINKNYYRMNTIKGIEWFEENTIQKDDFEYIVIHQTEFNQAKYNFRRYTNLEKDIRLIFESNKNCALAYLSLSNFAKITENIGTASNLILYKYFNKINETIPGLKVYRVNDIQFSFLIEKQEAYDLILKDLNNNDSLLLRYIAFFNDMKFELFNRLGIVESKNISIRTPQELMKAGNEALRFTIDPNYSKQFSIYLPITKDVKPIEDTSIDLSDDFLDKILNKK